jgi:hypothetical protein
MPGADPLPLPEPEPEPELPEDDDGDPVVPTATVEPEPNPSAAHSLYEPYPLLPLTPIANAPVDPSAWLDPDDPLEEPVPPAVAGLIFALLPFKYGTGSTGLPLICNSK